MKLVTIGSNCIDFYENLEGGTAFIGGGPVNMAVYTVRLGGEASYIGLVGRDDYGNRMQKEIAQKGVDISHLHQTEGKTAISYVKLVEGERIFGEYEEGVLSQYRLSEQDIDFICTHDMVVCDLWGKVADQLYTLKQRGVIIAFDAATRPEDNASQRAISSTDYFFFSTEGEESDETLQVRMQEYHRQGASYVIAMRGEQGSLCYDGTHFISYGIVPCPHVVDTMGAGDSYIAGFLFARMQGKDLQACMEQGARTATETIGYFGAW